MSSTKFAGSMQGLEETVDRMSVREKVGQMVMALNAPGWPGVSDVERLIRDHAVGSVISCAFSHLQPREAAERHNRLQRLSADSGAGLPLLNAGDFEQGLASQLPGVTPFPHQMGLAATRDADAAEEAARISGVEERLVGLHWSFSPTADVNTNPANPVIGVRSFGADTSLVSQLVAAQVRGLQSAGALATAKHFPGHGGADVDSHRDLPTIACNWKTMEEVHLPPFRAAIEVGVATIMTAHILVPALDPDLPGTLSHRTLTGLLREELGFDGIIVTDLMSMQAIAANWDVATAAVLSVQAGADVVLAATSTRHTVETIEALVRAVEERAIPTDRLNRSVVRVLQAKRAIGLLDEPYADEQKAEAGCATPEHLAFAADLDARSITVLRNDGALPFDAASDEVTLVAGVTNGRPDYRRRLSFVPQAEEMVRQLSRGPVQNWYAGSEEPTAGEIQDAVEQARSSDRVIVLTYSRGMLAQAQAELVDALARTGKPLVGIATGTPYDFADCPAAPAYLASYAFGFTGNHLADPGTLRAALAAVFGVPAPGKLS